MSELTPLISSTPPHPLTMYVQFTYTRSETFFVCSKTLNYVSVFEQTNPNRVFLVSPLGVVFTRFGGINQSHVPAIGGTVCVPFDKPLFYRFFFTAR